MPDGERPLTTPDGRYIIVRGRLWRASDPNLADDKRQCLVSELMAARRAVKAAADDKDALAAARDRVNTAKIALGERGPVWWHDGAPDLNKHMVETTHYGTWYRAIKQSG
ncbi:hypothetical protein [Rhizobium sp. FKL33]|uniref:hypothetical protein n=1 Tax=Rhizobium sp. FKL33 TaxID=2562307 RepID=UPI0010BFB56A|nr:hypothetical protein [Rhizobium sp. FKL33]